MPFVENLDMDRFAVTARQNASRRGSATHTDLTACDSLESAQIALAGILFEPSGKRTARYQRMVQMAVRFTRNAEAAYDLITSAYMSTAIAWERVTDAEGYMWRSVRNLAMMTVRDAKPEDSVGTVAQLAKVEQEAVEQRHYTPVVDGAVRSLEMLYQQATKRERKVIDLCFEQDSFNGLRQYTSVEAIAERLQVSPSSVTNLMKQLGIRAGVWTNEKRWFKRGAGSRRSQQYLRGASRPVWSVLGWYGIKSADWDTYVAMEWHKWTLAHAGQLFAEMAKEHVG